MVAQNDGVTIGSYILNALGRGGPMAVLVVTTGEREHTAWSGTRCTTPNLVREVVHFWSSSR